MISARLPSNLTRNATALAVESLRKRGIEPIDLTESNPTRAGFVYPDDLLLPLAERGALDYNPHPLGLLTAREAVSREFTRRGLQVSSNRIGLTASTSEAYSFLFKLLCDAGDAVLVPRPSYPLFEYLTRLESVAAVPYNLEYHGTWRIDMDSVRHARRERTRAVLVVSPNNPTGSFLHSDDLVQLAGLCAKDEIALIGDEVFADYPLDAAPHACSVLSQHDAVSCSLGGLSKSAGLPQLKLGWIAFNGPSTKLTNVLSAYEVVADAYLSVSTPIQTAASRVFEQGAAIRAQIQERIAANLLALRQHAVGFPAVTVLRCEGGWSAVVQLPTLRSEEALVLELLREDHVLVHPGYFFEFHRESFVVVSLIVEPSIFTRGIARLLTRATSSAHA
jgi:aspartate/methionine/tyrosine aminotransferase